MYYFSVKMWVVWVYSVNGYYLCDIFEGMWCSCLCWFDL